MNDSTSASRCRLKLTGQLNCSFVVVPPSTPVHHRQWSPYNHGPSFAHVKVCECAAVLSRRLGLPVMPTAAYERLLRVIHQPPSAIGTALLVLDSTKPRTSENPTAWIP